MLSTSPSKLHRKTTTIGNPVLLTASLGCAVTVLDTNLVGIVLPTIARELNATFADIEWVVSTYLLCFAALLLPAGAIADRKGRKRTLLFGLAMFTLASVACGAATTGQFLYLARAAQGVGAAFLLAPSLAIIGHAFHDEADRPRVWATWGAIMGMTMVLSPLAGGLLSYWLGWRSAFYINVPVCSALALAVLKFIPESNNPIKRPLDVVGIALFAATSLAFTWALIMGPTLGWLSVPLSVAIFCGALLLTLFIRVERRNVAPMLDLTLFQNRPFIGAIIAMLAYAATAQVMASMLPLFLQNAFGATALQAGIRMLPFALMMLLVPQLGRALSPFMQPYQILTLGLCIVSTGNVVMSWAALRPTNSLVTMIGMAILGAGGGLLNGETQKAIMGAVPPERAGMASGISTTSRFCGILLGFAGLGSLLSSTVRGNLLKTLGHNGLSLAPERLDRLAAGDTKEAIQGFGGILPSQIESLVHESFKAGFSFAFLAAGLAALTAAAAVYFFMRAVNR